MPEIQYINQLYTEYILKTSKTQENILAQDEENSESPRPITLLENV